MEDDVLLVLQDGDHSQVQEDFLEGDQAQDYEDLQDGDQAHDHEDLQDGYQAQADIDYSQYLIDINDNLDTLNSSLVDLQQDVAICRDNGYRQYYFIGGLYVVFFIIIAIKFFKQFF